MARYTGPDKINKVCYPHRWSQLKVSLDVNATRFVKLCSQSDFKGACHQIPSIRDVTTSHTGISTQDLSVCIPFVRSMRIQDGVTVTIHPGTIGPFVGPKRLTDVSKYHIKGSNSFHVFDTALSLNSTNGIGVRSEIKDGLKSDVKSEVKSDVKKDIKSDVKSEVKRDVKKDIKSDVKSEVKSDVKRDIKSDIKSEVKRDVKKEIKSDVKSDVKSDKNKS